MNESEMRTTLGTLRGVQQHAMEMLAEATPFLSGTSSAEQVAAMRQDHQRCAEELGDMLADMGGAPQSMPAGFEDLEREHSRLLHESGREDEVLEALLLTEETAAAHYGFASMMDLDHEMASLVRRHLEAEKRHIMDLQSQVGTLPVEIAGGGVGVDHMFVDDRNPDDFDSPSGLS